MATNVISQPPSATMELSAIVKIHKYKGFHEQHHFILMAMEIHNIFERDMDHFIKECVHLFHNKQSKVHLSLSFCIKFFRQHVSIILQHVLTSILKRKVVLTGDVYFKPPFIIKFHNFHASKQD